MYRVVRLLLAVLAPLFVALLAGPLHDWTQWPLLVCLALALAAVGTAVWAIGRVGIAPLPARAAPLFAALAVLFVLTTIHWLYTPALDGLAADAATGDAIAAQARSAVRFAEHAPAEPTLTEATSGPDRPVALYALVATARLVGVTAFASLRLAFYLGVVALAVALAAIAAIVATALSSRRALALFIGLTLALALPVLRWTVVPLLHACQAAGAFAQVLSLLPLALVWLLVGVVERPGPRALIALAGAVLVGSVDAIHFGGVALALAMLTFSDVIGAVGAVRRRLLTLSGGWMLAGGLALRQLFTARAATRPHATLDQFWIQFVVLAAALAMTAVPDLTTPYGVALSSVMRRLIAFARNFALASWAASYLYAIAHLARPSEVPLAAPYEALLVAPVLVAIIAFVPAVALVATTLLDAAARGEPLAAVGAPTTLAFAALVVWSLTAAFPASLREVRERSGQPPFDHLVPIDDRDADRFVGATLRERDALVGAIVVPGETGAFLAAVYDAPGEIRSPPSRGRCYFWSRPLGDLAPAITDLRERATSTCRSYHPRWAPETTAEICAVCL